MDTRTGVIADYSELAKCMTEQERTHFLRVVDPANLSKAHRAELARTGTTTVGPRSRCPCGSGHRFKRCCMYKPKRTP
jgi:uncharacterized protein YchJ